ncbi:MAG: PQQ-binding-like beta-propeller repeat protein [Planctomycetaceae bacterium]
MIHRRCLGLLLCLSVLSAPATHVDADEWPRFRGPDGMGRSTAEQLPTTWSDTKNVLWKTPLPGPGASSPIIWGDRLYVTCYSGYGVDKEAPGDLADLRRHLICVDRHTGKIEWNVEESDNGCTGELEGFVGLHGYASSTPVTDGDTIYTFYGCSGVYAYDMEGKQLWHTSVGERIDPFGSGTSPILYDDLLIINASVESRALIALDRKTGQEVWRAEDVVRSWNTPVIVKTAEGRDELVVAIRLVFKGFDPKTGEELWVCDAVRDYVCPSLVAHDDIVYGIGGRRGMALAVRAGGRGDVTESHILWKENVGSNVPSPVYHDGHLYWLDHKGIAYVLNAATGEEVLKRRESDTDRVYASLTYGDGKLYAVSRENGTFVYEAEPSLPLIAHNQFSEDDSIFNSSPVLLDERIYLRSDKFLYCIAP